MFLDALTMIRGHVRNCDSGAAMVVGPRLAASASTGKLVSGSHRSDDSVGLFGHDPTVGQSQRGTQSGYQIKSVNQAQDVLTTRKQSSINKKAHPKDGNARRNLLLNSAASRSRPSSKQPPILVGKERSFQEVSNATKNSKNGGRNQRETAIESDGQISRAKLRKTDPSINTKDQNDDVQEPAFSASTKLAQNRFQRSIQRIKLNDIVSPKTDPSVRAQLQNDGVLIKSDLTLKQQISAQLKQISALSNANKTTP
ncbi:calmodulin-binding transcription activator 6-like [Dorcoceras hygrometricum]|uniref:Calmodulin-binding transcription activator 6-like n=1 Tax=Dorcoceras hygrometricum TaxID=472368 RepID=A0A2Z7CQJ4_9LAMI|nr:calmodulin-binding transcription activator 6-like [Dorcoceras hygrometricum]